MNFDNDDILIASALSDMAAGLEVPELLPGIREKLAHRLRRRVKYVAAIIAAALLITGCAAALGAFDWLVGAMEHRGGFVDAVEPIEKSVTNEGIELTVIAAQSYGELGIAYVSVRDTESRGRADVDYLKFTASGAATVYNWVKVWYDESTQTALYELTLEIEDASLPLEVEINSISGDNQNMEPVKLDMDVYAAVSGGSDIDNGLADARRVMFGEPGEAVPGMDGLRFVWAGTVDGVPAMQFLQEWQGEFKDYSPNASYLLMPDGTRRYCDVRYAALDGDMEYAMNDMRYKLLTFIMDVSPEELRGASLVLYGKYKDTIAADWRVSCELPTVEGEKTYVFDMPVEGGVIEDVTLSVSPVGVRVRGTCPAELAESQELGSLDIQVMSGSVRVNISRARGSSFTDENGITEFDVLTTFYRTVQVEDITEIRVGDFSLKLD